MLWLNPLLHIRRHKIVREGGSFPKKCRKNERKSCSTTFTFTPLVPSLDLSGSLKCAGAVSLEIGGGQTTSRHNEGGKQTWMKTKGGEERCGLCRLGSQISRSTPRWITQKSRTRSQSSPIDPERHSSPHEISNTFVMVASG
jgi:hypothetical protein